MISGNQPVKAMTHICDLTLFGIVFNFPPNFEPPKSEGCDRYFSILYISGLFLVIFLSKDYIFSEVKNDAR